MAPFLGFYYIAHAMQNKIAERHNSLLKKLELSCRLTRHSFSKNFVWPAHDTPWSRILKPGGGLSYLIGIFMGQQKYSMLS